MSAPNEVAFHAGNNLLLRFTRLADRWAHTVEFRRSSEALCRLQSQEFGEDADWPLSPPWQNLQRTKGADGGDLVLLVGMAGSSHWSAAVEADPTGRKFVFDVACRTTKPPRFLGSNYLLAAASAGGGQRSLEILQIEILPMPDVLERCELWRSNERFELRVATNTLKLPQTIRWRYSIGF